MSHVLRYAARTDRGLVRQNNQDAVFAGDRLLIVADGMGGHVGGEVASRLAINAFIPLNDRKPGKDLLGPLDDATHDSNMAIAQLVNEDPAMDGMGTTITALLFDGNRLGIAHVGDSRAYLWRDGMLSQITHDDTFVQSLIDEGRITEDEAAHHPQRSLLLRAVNGTDTEPTLQQRVLQVGDRYLICSDGLSGVVTPEAIADTLASFEVGPAASRLIDLALQGGGPDNVTVIVADIIETGVLPGPAMVEEIDPDADLDATGPILPVHMTQRMPRIPLPEEVENPADAQLETAPINLSADDDDDEELDEEDDLVLTAPSQERVWWRRGAFTLALVLLVVLLGSGSYLWIRSQYYVGDKDGTVTVFRGVDGSVLGIKLASAIEDSCAGSADCVPLKANDLVPGARSQLEGGIPAPDLDEARLVISRLGQELLPACLVIPVDPPTSEIPASETTLTTMTTTSTVESTAPASVPGSLPASVPATAAPADSFPAASVPASITPAADSAASVTGPTGPRQAAAMRTGTADQIQSLPIVSNLMALAQASESAVTAASLPATASPTSPAPTSIPASGIPVPSEPATPAAPTPSVVVSEEVRTLVLTLTQTISNTSTVMPTTPAPLVPGVNCRAVGG